MISNKRILAVVPARGGSKGIPLKNLHPILGVPMVARVGHIVSEISIIDRAVVSTDDDKIAQVAEEAGLLAPFRRPESLSGDFIGDWDVLNHALLEMEFLDQVVYDIILMLQPTSPMRRAEDVSNTLNMLIKGNWDAVWTVSESDSKAHPLKQLIISDDGDINYYDQDGETVIARQQLLPVYHRNGVAYAITRDSLINQKTIKGERTGAMVISGNHISIDTKWDVELVEFIMQREGLT